MKKFALPMGILAILIAGVLFFMNQKEKVVPTADNEIVVSDIQREDNNNVSEVNKEIGKTLEKSAKVDSGEVSEAKEGNNKVTVKNQEFDNFAEENLIYDEDYPNAAPTIKEYQPKQEWFIPSGDPEKFELTQEKAHHAFGVNYQYYFLSLNRELLSETASKSKMTQLISEYTSAPMYFIQTRGMAHSDNFPLWTFTVKLNKEESQKLLQELNNDIRIKRVSNHGDDIMPMFNHIKHEVWHEYSKNMIN